MRPIGSCTRNRRRHAEARGLAAALAVALAAGTASGQSAGERSADLPVGDQPDHTTLVNPPFAHTLGIHRARPAHLKLFLGDRTRFDDPQGLAAVKFASDDDPELRGDDYQLTLFGVNAGRGEILYNSSMRTLAVYGRRGAGEGSFDQPHGIAATVDGRVYVADTGNRRIARLRWEPTRRALSWVGSWEAGAPFDVDADARGFVWASDREAGTVIGFADRDAGAAGPALPPPIVPDGRWPLPGDVEAPLGLAVADSLDPWLQPDENRLYLVDRDGGRLRAFDAEGRVVAAVEPADVAPGRPTARFFYVALDYFGHVWVSDPAGGVLYKLDRRLRPLDVFAGPGEPESALEEPRGIAIWKRFGQVFVAEREGARYFFVGADVEPTAEPVVLSRREARAGWSLDLFLTEPATVRFAFLGAAGDTLAVADAGLVGAGRRRVEWDASGWEAPPREGWEEGAETVVVEARPTYSSRRRFARVRTFPVVAERALTGP